MTRDGSGSSLMLGCHDMPTVAVVHILRWKWVAVVSSELVQALARALHDLGGVSGVEMRKVPVR